MPSLIYGPPAKEHPRLAALRSLSEDQRDNQILEASRERDNQMAEGTPAHVAARPYYRAVQLAEDQHKARVDHADRHFNPRRYMHSQFRDLGDGKQAVDWVPTPEDPTHLEHATQWLTYQLHEMDKSPEADPTPAQRMVSNEEWVTTLRDQVLDRLARKEAEALGYGFS